MNACQLPPGSSTITTSDGVLRVIVVTHDHHIEGGGIAGEACELPPGCSTITASDGEVMRAIVVTHDHFVSMAAVQ